ncbi:hypothetical protein LguiA_012611 [Lonicera macranthoides]
MEKDIYIYIYIPFHFKKSADMDISQAPEAPLLKSKQSQTKKEVGSIYTFAFLS